MATRRTYAGAARSTTITGSITSGATSATLADATGWPDGSAGPFFVTLDSGTVTEEKVLVTSRAGVVLSFTAPNRGADGTTASAHSAGASIACTISATDLDEANSHLSSLPGTAADADTATGLHHTIGSGASQVPSGTHVHDGTSGNGPVLTQSHTHSGADTDVATSSLHHTLGGGATQAINGAHTHAGGGNGAVLVQANTHSSPDTDTATSALHHTIGTGANQSAAGNHIHTTELFAGLPNAAQTLATATYTDILFDGTEVVDRANGHSTTVSPARYTVQSTGVYRVSGGVSFAANATGTRSLQVLANAAVAYRIAAVPAAAATINTEVSGSRLVSLTAGDFVTLQARQDSGGNLNTVITVGNIPFFQVEGPL